MSREAFTATAWGLGVSVALGGLILVGSRNLQHFDAALVGYTFATLFATFGVTYRYSMWLQRPPTALYWRRGWQYFFRPRFLGRNLVEGARRLVGDFALNGFIFRRSPRRGLAHLMIMWGCLLAAAITFPLVFGWIHFETPPTALDHYTVVVFGFPTVTIPVHSLPAFMMFHGLVWSAFLVTAGVMLALQRRFRDHGAAAAQMFSEDFLPLVLLFAVSLTGLMLTASYTWMKGYAYEFLALVHAMTVIGTLLWLPFGKFFHLFQRPAQIGAALYREVATLEGEARCRRCAEPYAPAVQVQDLAVVERQLGYRYELAQGHYQEICPRCRRLLPGLAQARLWRGAANPELPMALDGGDRP